MFISYSVIHFPFLLRFPIHTHTPHPHTHTHPPTHTPHPSQHTPTYASTTHTLPPTLPPQLRIGQESDSEDTTPEVTKPEQPDPVPHLRLNHAPTRSGSSIRRRMTIRRKDSAPDVPKKLSPSEVRAKIVEEILNTERVYVQNLEDIVEVL